ncbi:tetratricopeptide repeat protein [Kribbella qitaiheensis]|uniref:Tetratricopeptide repeat protein n=1 Tax=Kribbella qitaiheensis TaxID=1544730 RepID=A0A7G6X950_9ACTN|nr:tetratricopeptide repeat protein [Kribbella qitaiheensis]
MGDWERAAALFEQTLTARVRVLGPYHADTLNTRNGLADAYHEAGDRDAAAALFEQTLVDCRRVLGRKHPLTRLVRANLTELNRIS